MDGRSWLRGLRDEQLLIDEIMDYLGKQTFTELSAAEKETLRSVVAETVRRTPPLITDLLLQLLNEV